MGEERQGTLRKWLRLFQADAAARASVKAYVSLLSAECASLDPLTIPDQYQTLYLHVTHQLELWRDVDNLRLPRWAELSVVEAELLRLLPDEALPAKAQLARDRLRDVVGDAGASGLSTSTAMEPKTLREELKQLIAEFHFCCAVRQEQELSRTRLMWYAVLGFFLTGLVLAGPPTAISFVKNHHGYFGSIVPAVVMGAFGGCVSIYLRMQRADFRNRSFSHLMDLRHGGSTIVFAPFFGAISAGTLFLLFAAQILTGGPFPDVGIPDNIAPGNYGQLIVSANPPPGADMIKLLLWSFVAGFGERLMPSVLSRLGDKIDVPSR